MYQLPELRLFIGNRPTMPQRWFLGAHGVGRCEHLYCPMHEIAERFSRPMYDPPLDDLPIQWRTGGMTGFRTTSIFQAYGDPSQWDDIWHIMPVEDCLGSGGNVSLP